MNQYFRKVSLLLLVLVAAVLPAGATHIVGGEITYKWLGGNTYQIRLDIYQDCIAGDPNAIAQDNPAIIAVFNGSGARLMVDTIPLTSSLLVPSNFSNSCINNPPKLCLTKASFIKTYSLPPSSNGYFIVHQRCCRNGSIMNLIDPAATGATYYTTIPRNAELQSNNTPVFRNYPPQIICINNPLVYDHSATDQDGDSLSYEFCPAYAGGSDRDAKPTPSNINFQQVSYSGGFSPKMPMSGNPPLQIDPRTGMITGTPNQIGRFVVTVCCHEWRNGVMINTVSRDFQFVVTNCSKAVVANIPQLSDEFNTYIVKCKGYSVHFQNLSTGANADADAYSWDFGVPNISSDTSHLKEPDFTYPDTGTYLVKLLVNRGSTCRDSISRLVKVYPEFQADFEISGLPCPKSPVQFTDKSSSTYKPISYYNWSFGDGTFSSEANPAHIYDTGGTFQVRLFAKNIKGCADTAVKEYEVEQFHPFAGNDTIIVKGESIIFKATGGSRYTWTPSTYLNNPNISNPIGYYPDTTRLDYYVHIESEMGCVGDDTINVWVVGQSAIFVPSAFSPNGDGRNDVLRPIGIGFRNINYFRVFNRWGQQVYYGIHFNEGWDGYNQAKPADIGTYYWELSLNDRFGKEVKMKGDATLIR